MPLNYASKLDAAILERARVELGEDEQRREQSVAIIREWLKKQPHLVNCPIGNRNLHLQIYENFLVLLK